MTETRNPQDYIDDRNRALFDRLAEVYTIDLQRHLSENNATNLNEWSMIPQGDTIKILYYQDTNSNSYFTHELLHAQLILDGFTHTAKLLADGSPVRRDSHVDLMLTLALVHIQNILAHAKMHAMYTALGFPPEEFTCDYHDVPQIDVIIRRIDSGFDSSGLPNDSITSFITSFFTIMDNRNPVNAKHYARLANHLREKDPALYNILSSHWSNWVSSNGLDNEAFFGSLAVELKGWYMNKTNRGQGSFPSQDDQIVSY